jgi:hypothetical protein
MSTKSRLISGRVPVTTAANVASDRYQYLDLSSAEPNLGTGNTGDVLIYDSSYAGGRKWIPQSDIRGSIGESAFVEANTASANTVYLSAVDVTQNNRISVLETVNGEQNTRITAIDAYADGAYGKANSANVLAQAAFDKANTGLASSGGSITGSLAITQDLTVTGNLTVLGNSTTLTTSTLEVDDTLIYLAANNYYSDALDIGLIAHYNDGANAHTGIFRDANLKEWIFFKGYTPEVESNNLINIAHPSFAYANVYGDYFKGSLITNGVDIYNYTSSSFAQANAAFTQANAANQYANSAYAKANTVASDLSTYSSLNDGINATQNTNIGIIQGVDTAQNTRMSIVEGVDVGQNTRMSIIEGVDVAQNTRMNIIEGVDTAQNTRMIIIEGVDTTQNTNITIIQGVDTWQNTQITNISSLAQAAFNKANTGARATASNTAPTGNTVGDLWLSLTDETLYLYSYDGVSNNWVDISGPILISSNILVQYTITSNVS